MNLISINLNDFDFDLIVQQGVLLKFERFPPTKQKVEFVDDAIVIENDQEKLPVIIEAKRIKHFP